MTVPLIGRSRHLDLITGALREGRPVLVVGGRGTGRSILLAEAARRQTGTTVLAVRALPGDEALPGAGLQRLLTPVQRETAELPAPAAAAFARIFGVDAPAVEPAPLAEAMAMLLDRWGHGGRRLFCVDDLDRLDELSRTVLTEQTRIPFLASTGLLPGNGFLPGTGFLPGNGETGNGETGNGETGNGETGNGNGIRTVRLGRLSREDAERLLGTMPGVRAHPGARLLLAQAAGNPLALTELAAHLPPPAELPPTSTELPVPPRLRRALAPAVETLDDVRLEAALLAAFATETPGRNTRKALDALIPPRVWAGLTGSGVLRPGRARRFTHPVTRAAVIERAGFTLRQETRRRLAGLLPPDDPARAWHTARSSTEPDETAANHLDRIGTELLHRGSLRAAAYALGLAAASGPDPDAARARRLRAAICARHAGEPAWEHQLAHGETHGGTHGATYGGTHGETYGGTHDGTQGQGHDGTHGQAHDGTHGEARGERTGPLEAADLGRLLRIAWLRGDDQTRGEIRELVRAGGIRASELLLVWARALVDDADPDGDASRLLNAYGKPHRNEGMPPDHRAVALGTIALARHETALARRHLTRAADLSPPGGLNRPVALGGLAWVAYDAGDLTTARELAEQTLRVTDRDRHATIIADTRAGALTTIAAVSVLREEADHEEHVGAARGALQYGRHTLHDLRLDRAQGLIAGIRGEHGLAFHRLRRHFDDDGRPLHHRISDLSLADLAQVAVALGRGIEIKPLLAYAEARVRTLRSVRVTAIWNRAHALLAGPEAGAETYFRLALADPGTDQWAFERALTRMDYAQWLRRRQRPAESRPLLGAARDVFAAAGLHAWADRAAAELAAAGSPGPAPAVDGLTPQQRQVVTLAAQGLTNPQIAARLGLSARTVGTHLSRAYPILGVTRRTQLPGLSPTD
ncbi:LuxR C-terminal-related transcriptional regulator [Actinoplanes sp. NPDC051851]|uniref:helix-turn-helix transcriptional regulator n=1 Tax=Actinoplanes sp. NPDC051851 TaxID=3154753 RepID=UPI00343D3A0B